MATHKLLNNVGSAPRQLAGSAANIHAPSGVTGMVKTIVLHNTQASTTETVEIFFNAATDNTRMLNVALAAGETFEWSLGHMIVLASGEVLKGQSTNADKVNYWIFGAEE